MNYKWKKSKSEEKKVKDKQKIMVTSVYLLYILLLESLDNGTIFEIILEKFFIHKFKDEVYYF